MNRYLEWSKAWEIDIAMRYHPIAQLLRQNTSPQLRILEAGAGGKGITAFHPVPITALDIRHADNCDSSLINQVTASSEHIPLADNSFDILISVDMFEHLDSKARAATLCEFFRTAAQGGTIFIAVPCGKLASFHEKALNALYKIARKKDHPWLKEHIDNGLPETKELYNQIQEICGKDSRIMVKDNVNIFLWFWLFIVRSMLPSVIRRPVMQSLFPALKYINFLPYRKLFVISVNKK